MQSREEEFLQILSEHQGILHKVSLLYFKTKHEREDNIQEIIYQLWKSYSTFRNQSKVGSWIYSVAINISISRIKKQKRIRYRENVPEQQEKSNIIDNISKDESLQLLLNAIYKLDEIYKSIIFLYLEEKSYEEMADILGIKKSNVGVRINRAKGLLKEELKKQGLC